MPRVALALAGLLLGACSPPEERFHAERIIAMGTFVDVVVEVPDPAHRTALLRDIEAYLRGFERDYYAWADGELARLNRSLERGEAIRVTPELAGLLRAAQRYGEQSKGALEPGIGALVELWGFHDGTAALAAFQADPRRFDLVLTDEVMPELTGTELAAALHRIRPELPIVLMTGYVGPVEPRALAAAGIREVLKKPLLSRPLADCLASHLPPKHGPGHQAP